MANPYHLRRNYPMGRMANPTDGFQPVLAGLVTAKSGNLNSRLTVPREGSRAQAGTRMGIGILITGREALATASIPSGIQLPTRTELAKSRSWNQFRHRYNLCRNRPRLPRSSS
jgi:hypothetical protein